MVEFNIFISISGEELFDICLLFRQEFQLSQFVTVVLSFAAEVVSHLEGTKRSVYLRESPKMVEEPRIEIVR